MDKKDKIRFSLIVGKMGVAWIGQIQFLLQNPSEQCNHSTEEGEVKIPDWMVLSDCAQELLIRRRPIERKFYRCQELN
jgi:hypothetical protein